jgi:hypothetical protein
MLTRHEGRVQDDAAYETLVTFSRSVRLFPEQQ